MKKSYTKQKFKRYNHRRAKRSLARNLRFKEYQRLKNQSELGLERKEKQHKRTFEDKYKNYIRVKAPENLTLIGNPEPVIKFINKLRDCYDKNKKAFVVLQEVKNIDYDAIVVLLSIMVRFKARRIDFNGDFPDNDDARNLLYESGFFLNLNRQFRDEDRYDVRTDRKNTIHTHAWKNVDSVLGSKLIENAAETIWGQKKRCQGAQRTLLE